MHKPAETSVPVHEVISNRWSPRGYDSTATVSEDEITALLEAARWAPSAMNNQPWRFAIAKRGEEKFTAISETLAGFNKAWAPNASAFIVACIETLDAEGNPRKWAEYELGLAVGAMLAQATASGLFIHQMAGFSAAKITAALSLKENVKPLVVLTVGRLGKLEDLDEEVKAREIAPRSRVALSEIVI